MRIGFIGLGAMGAGIVSRLLAAGHTVTGWNRTKSRAEALLQEGMGWADSPRDAASQSDVVLSIVTDAAAVRDVALGPPGVISGLAEAGIYLDMSTISPDASRAIAAEFKGAGLTTTAAFLECRSRKSAAVADIFVSAGERRGVIEIIEIPGGKRNLFLHSGGFAPDDTHGGRGKGLIAFGGLKEPFQVCKGLHTHQTRA